MNRLTLPFLCLLPFGALSIAQPSPSVPISAVSPGQPQTVRLNVLVKDKSGSPVPGLTEQDFTVTDNGRPEKLLGFKPVDTRANPGEVKVLIVIDMINLPPERLGWAREQVGQFLKQNAGKLSHPTSIAAMTQGRLRQMNRYTTDGIALETALLRIGVHRREVNRDAGWAGDQEMLDMSLQQFNQILAAAETTPGRTMVLFVSPGWPMLYMGGLQQSAAAQRWVFNVDVSLTNAIGDAHATIYQLRPFRDSEDNPFFYTNFVKPVSKVEQAEYPFLAMGVFAVHSGGRVLVRDTDISGKLSDAMRDAASYYELTYTAPFEDAANQYHAISVRVSRPDAKAYGLQGYYANPRVVAPGQKLKKH